jgi:hypothetical protein
MLWFFGLLSLAALLCALVLWALDHGAAVRATAAAGGPG